MAATVTERPYQYNFSRNDIRYVFNVTDLARPGLYLEVKLFHQKIGGAAVEVFSLPYKPNPDGTVYVYIADWLDSYLNWVPPVAGQILTSANDQVTEFYIHFREITDAIPDPAWETPEDNNVRLVIKGGIDNIKAARNNVFVNYIETAKPFLTWQPSGRYVWSDQKLWITAFNPYNVLSTYDIHVVVRYTDNTTTTHDLTLAAASPGKIVHIAADLVTLGIVVAKTVYYYDISIMDGAVAMANAYRFFVEYNPVYQYYDLIYHNSLGGVDPVRIVGEIARALDFESGEAEGGIKLDDWQSAVKPHHTITPGITGRRRFKGNLGYQINRSFQEAMLDILFSESIYQLIDSRWIPVIKLQKSLDLNKSTDKTFGFPIEWALSAASQSFTPESKTFGAGDHTEIYP